MNSGFPAHLLPSGIPPVVIRQLEKDQAVNLPDPHDRGWFLYGDAGHGKTHQASALLLHLLEKDPGFQRRGFRWVNVPEMLFELRSSYGNDPRYERELISSCSTVGWLCLDDLGAEKISDWTLSTLYLIINKRYERELTTVITSNLSLDEMIERFGDDRLVSRIRGMCLPVQILSAGGDKRIAHG
jgi:DNA replication protein DnaC